MKKIKKVKVNSVSYVHDPNAAQQWCDIYLDVLLNAKQKEKEMNSDIDS